MTTYNTGNPLGSADPNDLFDNAQNLDKAVNVEGQDKWIDRLGRERLTWDGMTRLSNLGAAVEAAERAEAAADVAEQVADMNTYLTKADAVATLPQPEGTIIRVTNDPNPDNNGYWVSDGTDWIWSGLQPLSGRTALVMRGVLANGASIGSASAPGVYLLGASRSYLLMPEDAPSGVSYWLEVLPYGEEAGLETTGRFVMQRLTAMNITDSATALRRRRAWTRRLDRQNPDSLVGANGWAPIVPGTDAGLALLGAADVAEQRDILGIPASLTYSPRLGVPPGTDLSTISEPGIYILQLNGGYIGVPSQMDTSVAHWMCVSPGMSTESIVNRFVYIELMSMAVKTVDGVLTRDVFSRRLDLLNPTAYGGNGRWVQLSGAPAPVPPPPPPEPGTVEPETRVPYVEGGELRVTDFDGDRLLNDDAGVTWIAAQASAGEIQAVREIAGQRSIVSVAPDSGDIYAAVETDLKLGAGQSNGRGSQQGDPSFVIEPWPNEHGDRLAMPFPNVWAGTGTSGTAVFDPASVTSLVPYEQKILTNCGPSAIEAAALRYADRALASGLKPRQIVANVAVGTSSMASLNNEPPTPGNTRWDNLVAILERIHDLRRNGEKIRCRWIDMHQGEGDQDNASLGQAHDDYRARIEGEIQRIFGQAEPVKMLTWQNAAYSAYKSGVYSLIDHHIANAVPWGNFFCAGPCYEFPMTAEYLHHNALGHMMRGELADEIMRRIDRYGDWVPLYMVSATVTGVNEITVALSHPAVIDTTHPRVAPIEDAGITLDGGTVAGVSVSGTTMTITTAGAASSVVAVRAAFVGQSSPRTAERIPRTNIRGTADLGRYRVNNEIMRRWLCPQSIVVS